MASDDTNVYDEPLSVCCTSPMTGFFRTGCCETDNRDQGAHVICAQVTEDFLAFAKSSGNDLSTPRPEFGFAGLRPGDRWCVCAGWWRQALEAGVAPPIVLQATHKRALEYVSMVDLKKYALDLS